MVVWCVHVFIAQSVILSQCVGGWGVRGCLPVEVCIYRAKFDIYVVPETGNAARCFCQA